MLQSRRIAMMSSETMEGRLPTSDDGTVRIPFAGGSILLPARSPYEWETVLDHVRHRLRVDGRACLELNGRRCIVQPSDAGAEVECCFTCGRALEQLACRVAASTYCLACVRAGTLQSAPARTEEGEAPIDASPRRSLPV